MLDFLLRNETIFQLAPRVFVFNFVGDQIDDYRKKFTLAWRKN